MRLRWLASLALASCIFDNNVTANILLNPLHPISNHEGKKDNKYFHEPGRNDLLGHYDARFFGGLVSDEVRKDTLTQMTKAYLTFFRENKLETWIAHGTLLAWWWNGMILPWDWDVDTQVNTETLFLLGDKYNQTMYSYSVGSEKRKRQYLLDVNPWSRQRPRGDGDNIIDARWIDTQNGLFIDITGISELDPDKEPGVLSCKNHHKYKAIDIYPMRESSFEGVPAKIPFRYNDILIKEYGHGSLLAMEFEGHDWDPQRQEWIPDPVKMAVVAKKKEEKYLREEREREEREEKARAELEQKEPENRE
ncbi:hypothetical protein FQN57_003862 [Myotisia sp. PD_48]|nr:hypothetical protein FQN57_003862 [Myotisia sp. PD_48]